ncbi:MAG: DNA helicase RecQ [Steroidobacteraceae bacterium]
MDVDDEASRILREVFGYSQFRGEQRDVIAHLIAGGDALVLMPTGGGKSLCYQIPALARDGMGVVVSPLIALMQDQVAALQEAGVRAAALNSALSWHEVLETERQARAGELELLYVAPERLVTERCLTLLDQCPLAILAIDEAHCVSQWGHDFRPEYLQLAVLAERYRGVPRIALTATADSATRKEIVERLRLNEPKVFIASFDRPNISYRIAEKDNPRRQLLRFIREGHPGESGIVYCLARASVEDIADYLARQRIDALPYHAGLDSGTREDHQRRFIRDDGIVMVATIAFGMGIDKPDVRFVAHLDLPKSIEGYYQETGRAGRDGLPADAWMVYGLQDVVQQRRMIDQSEASADYKRVASAKLDALLGLCETTQCRRVRLLDYFGEAAAPCGNCDNCLDRPEEWDGTVAAQKLLSCIARCESATGFGFGAQHIIDILRGNRTAKVEQFRHERLSTFGIGSDLDAAQWRSVLRQLVMLRLVHVDTERYSVLRLTAACREVLRGERAIRLRRAIDRGSMRTASRGTVDRMRVTAAQAARVLSGGYASGADDNAHLALFEALRAWRLQVAREHGVPAYTVFHDSTLEEIARRRPGSTEELRAVSGVGAVKLERYGAAVLDVLQGAQRLEGTDSRVAPAPSA